MRDREAVTELLVELVLVAVTSLDSVASVLDGDALCVGVNVEDGDGVPDSESDIERVDETIDESDCVRVNDGSSV